MINELKAYEHNRVPHRANNKQLCLSDFDQTKISKIKLIKQTKNSLSILQKPL